MNKKVVAVTVMALIAFSAIGGFGCDGKTQGQFPEYTEDKVMMIGGWDAPKNTLDDYQLAKDMGLNHMFIDDLFVKRGTKEYADVLGFCEKTGLKAIITVGNAGGVEYAGESWKNDITDYSDFPSVKAINYWDEPNFSQIKRVGELAEENVKKYGDKVDVFANLFPNTATNAFEGHTYDEYVKEYVDKVLSKVPQGHRYLSADVYPLLKGREESQVRSNWLNCIETIVNNAKTVDAIPHFFIQATEHYEYRAITEEDIRWQFYVYMAFGAKAFTYFTYRSSILEGFSNSCVDTKISGKTYPVYHWAKKVNNEILNFDNVYLNFEWNGTMPIIGENNTDGYNRNFDGLNNPLLKIDVIDHITAKEDALVGQFKDKDGNNGLMIVNFNDPTQGIRNKINIDFKNASKVRVYKNGQFADYQVLNNHFELKLGVGEGAFIIPVL